MVMHFNKSHNPKTNQELIRQLSGTSVHIETALLETERFFSRICTNDTQKTPDKSRLPRSLSQKLSEGKWRLTAKTSTVLERTSIKCFSDGQVVPDWIEKLEQEYKQLLETIEKEVNVLDFGGVADGKTDCTAAFKSAIGKGRVKVIVPEGVYIVKEVKLPSNTVILGAGKGKTTLKLHDDAPKSTRLLTNAHHWLGDHHICVESMSLDWNVERLGLVENTSAGGNKSSCLTFANVTFGWVKDVEGINPGLHCFDISATKYNYAGDGYRARGSSRYVWLDGLSGFGFGDDGITTHHSDYLFISRCHMCCPSGRSHQKGFSNSNGIEVDDGSRNVLLAYNSTAYCFGGVEIKAHGNSSAASNVQIVGHLSFHDNRSYNFRHIGHHKHTDAESKSAYNILANQLISMEPSYCDLYKDSSPRALVVSAYRNVVINGLTVIGDPNLDFKRNPICAIQYRAKNVVLNQISIRNFLNAGPGIKLYGGKNRADFVEIYNVFTDNSIAKPLEISKDIDHVYNE